MSGGATRRRPMPTGYLPGCITALSRAVNPGVPVDLLSPMTFLVAYFDESASSDLDGVMTLAGWVGTPAAWEAFSVKWTAMLEAAPHPVDEFHASDLFQGAGQFSDQHGWTREERLTLQKQATEILCSRDLATRSLGAFGCTYIPRLAGPRIYSKHEINELWKMCFLVSAVLPIEMMLRAGLDDGKRAINFVFDYREKMENAVRDYMDELRHRQHPSGRKLIGSTTFVDSKDYPPIQAADYLAFERRIKTTRSRGIGHTNKNRTSYRLLKESGRSWRFKVLDERFRALMMEELELNQEDPRYNFMDRIPDDLD